jgi:TPP-dependent pyruvate/acetoin dehydrogenase alpha subunit
MSPTVHSDVVQKRYLAAYRWMILARVLEEKLAALAASKIKGGVFLGKGQEALSAAIGTALGKGDIFAPSIRDMAGRLAFGEPVADALRTYLGSRLGPMRGRDGNIHRGRPKEGSYAMISHLGVMLSTVAGGLFARRARGEKGVVGAVCFGDGATSTGSFHEGMNMVAVEKLPLVIVIANNQYAYSTRNTRQFACDDLVQRAAGYGVQGHSIDGTDPLACFEIVHEAVRRARAGGGPQMIVAKLLRLAGHGQHDAFEYLDKALKNSPAGRDCLEVAREQMLATNWSTAAELDALRAQARGEVEEAYSVVLREPAPDPGTESWAALSTAGLVENMQ